MRKYLSLALLVGSLGQMGCTAEIRKDKVEAADLKTILNSAEESEMDEATDTAKQSKQKQKTELSPRKLEQQALLDVQKSVYCIRNSTMFSLGGDNNEELMAQGSGFVLYKKDGWTYLTTSKHMISPDIIIEKNEEWDEEWDEEWKMEGDEEGIIIKMKISETISLVEDCFDEDASDDIKMEIVTSDEDLDSIILRTKADLHLPQPYKYLDLNDSIKEGDPVYVLGFPEGVFKAVTQGIIANHLIEFIDGNITAIDGTIQSGNSGGPIFYRSEEGELYLIGQSMSCFPYRGELCGGFLFTQDINKLRKFWFSDKK